MKFYLKLPGGGEMYFEKEPIDKSRFIWICTLILIFMVGSGILELLSMTVRR